MSAPQYPYPYPATPPPPPSSNSGMMTALAAGAIVASLAFNGFLLYELHDLRTDTAKSNEIMQNEIETLKENSTVITATQRKHLDDLKQDLENRSRQANAAASQAKKEALSYADQQAEKLEAENRRTADNVNKVNSDLSTVRQSADAANAKIADVGTDVTGVKSDLASTKTTVQQTISDLKAVRGDLGGTQSLVATNGKELDELIKRGERNIVKFNISKKTKGYQKVGDISLVLKNADPKKNKFSLDVMADDKVVEKKDRNINEPLQFYVYNSLYELVVNTVGKDTVSGYLSTPKYTARNN
jgi:chromosome segregation ATPase